MKGNALQHPEEAIFSKTRKAPPVVPWRSLFCDFKAGDRCRDALVAGKSSLQQDTDSGL
jgi:hypothetical protein